MKKSMLKVKWNTMSNATALYGLTAVSELKKKRGFQYFSGNTDT